MRTHSSASILPLLPIARLVTTAQSRSQPSSCEDEVRSFSGQSGQVSVLFSFAGGLGMISSWVTDAAPWPFAVPTQPDPVSPPPITTTYLPVPVIDPRGAARTSSSPEIASASCRDRVCQEGYNPVGARSLKKKNT